MKKMLWDDRKVVEVLAEWETHSWIRPEVGRPFTTETRFLTSIPPSVGDRVMRLSRPGTRLDGLFVILAIEGGFAWLKHDGGTTYDTHRLELLVHA